MRVYLGERQQFAPLYMVLKQGARVEEARCQSLSRTSNEPHPHIYQQGAPKCSKLKLRTRAGSCTDPRLRLCSPPYSVTSNRLFKHSDEDMRWVCPNQQWRHKDSNTDSQVYTRCDFAYRTRQTEVMNPRWQQTRVCQGGAEGLIPKGLEGFHSKMVRAFYVEGSG